MLPPFFMRYVLQKKNSKKKEYLHGGVRPLSWSQTGDSTRGCDDTRVSWVTT